jgi:hypothetical protein
MTAVSTHGVTGDFATDRLQMWHYKRGAEAEYNTEFQKLAHEENLKLDQVYNTDMSGLYWKGLPTRTLTYEIEKCATRHKSSKEPLQSCVVEVHPEITN